MPRRSESLSQKQSFGFHNVLQVLFNPTLPSAFNAIFSKHLVVNDSILQNSVPSSEKLLHILIMGFILPKPVSLLSSLIKFLLLQMKWPISSKDSHNNLQKCSLQGCLFPDVITLNDGNIQIHLENSSKIHGAKEDTVERTCVSKTHSNTQTFKLTKFS